MRDDGYTVAEMLVAVAIIGLAFGGMFEAARTLGAFLRAATGGAAHVQARTAIARTLDVAVAGNWPFFSNQGGFVGDADHFAFACSAGSCGATIARDGPRIVLVARRGDERPMAARLPEGAAFRYADVTGETDAWPPTSLPPRRLAAISIVTDAGHEPLATERLAIDEPPNCVFDPIAQACRISQ